MKKFTQTFSMGLLCTAMNAAYAGALQPDAGSLQQQINPDGLPAKPAVSLDDFPAFHVNEIKDSTRFIVKSIRIIGNQDIDAITLHGLVKDLVGGQHSLSELQEACQRITDYYHSQGFGLARAILPPQEIIEGRVTIQVVEAKYGEVEIDNKSRVNTSLIAATLSRLKQGNSIKQYDLDKALLFLTDLPGAQTSALLKAGKNTAESDIVIEMNATPMLTGRVALDNWGNVFINRSRLAASLNVYNPAGYGDVFSLNYLTTGERMQFARASYDTLINGRGTRVGGAYTALQYRLGDEIKALDANGTANTYEAYLKHPLIRSRMHNLFFNLQHVSNQLKDHIDASNFKSDRDVNSTVISVNGDTHDDFLGGGVNSYSLAYTLGNLHFTNVNAENNDARTRNTAGHFSKWVFNINRLQSINDRTQLWMSMTMQRAQDNLDSSQKMSFGGPYSVRAYDNGTVSADNGHLLSIELRRFMGDYHGKIQGLLFVDLAHLEVNQNRWLADTGIDKASLCGAGFGLQWLSPNQITTKVVTATSVGSGNILTESGDKRLIWFEIAKYY